MFEFTRVVVFKTNRSLWYVNYYHTIDFYDKEPWFK